jgi:hypothetical protein
MRRSIIVLVFALTSCVFVSAQMSQDDSGKWKPLNFLLGTWEARTAAATADKSPQASGSYTFATELHGTVLARHSSADNCKGPADFNCAHQDLLYLFHDQAAGANDSGIRAIYFDGEGHVIHYTVSLPAANTAVFQSEPAPGPQFRLIYELSGGVMKGKFQVAAPGQTEYKSYLEWSGKRK